MIDIILIAVIGLVTWLVASDGAWSAAIAFISSIIGGLIAMNYFEPLANFLSATVATQFEWQQRLDIICLLGLFALSVFGLRFLGDKLLPTYAEVIGPVYDGTRWGFAALTGYVVMAVLCTSLHVAPLPREFLGFAPERANLLGTAPDRQWLAFTQYVSEKSMRNVNGSGTLNIFDGVAFPSNPDDRRTMRNWASFPIKYATRRQNYAAGQAAAASNQGVAPPPTNSGGSQAPNAGTGGF
ncbi:CvpA family protein [Planctomicrobium sp. SH668]|uniref:CvpA family protein n=1 Tax=Planctomicrobium sp. SH668 TaxID=3448126 RepID=UPI003F5C78CD